MFSIAAALDAMEAPIICTPCQARGRMAGLRADPPATDPAKNPVLVGAICLALGAALGYALGVPR